jgi:hypothetical protein
MPSGISNKITRGYQSAFRPILLLLLVIIFSTIPALGKTRNREMANAIYVEYGGNAGLYSINYDRRLFRIDQHACILRAGFSWIPFRNKGIDDIFLFPITASYTYNIGKSPHFLEFGGGVTVRTASTAYVIDTRLYPAISIGYRIRSQGTGSTFRIGFTPIFFENFLPWVGLSLGRSF